MKNSRLFVALLRRVQTSNTYSGGELPKKIVSAITKPVLDEFEVIQYLVIRVK